MTQISGKIYQLKNAAGTENRFPRTVMEAVIGLNSYLQQQFNALADIYMPIEGISEALNDQEFVYRISPNTIKAKSLTLDRILGRTLAWNQKYDASTFVGKTENGITFTKNADGSITISGTATADTYAIIVGDANFITNHKYAIIGLKTGLSWRFNVSGSVFTSDSIVTRGTVLGNLQLSVANGTTLNMVFWPKVCDLTLMFGSGNEPSTVAEFESLFPLSYYPYDAGTLISNDASEIETVGRNVWDEEWELGGYSSVDGSKSTATTTIRSANKIRVSPLTNYYVLAPSGCWVYCWDADGNFITKVSGNNNYITVNTSGVITTPANCYNIAIQCFAEYGTTYNNDICINLSDESKNGTYEPYRKSTLNLGLNSFKVKDAQGNVITVNGLKSAGSVYDEIVGNKYVKRIGEVDLGTLAWAYSNNEFSSVNLASLMAYPATNDDVGNILCSKYLSHSYTGTSSLDKVIFTSWQTTSLKAIWVKDSAYTDAAAFKAAMQGVMLYYELATPIEYELVEPLVPTLKAGTTEARISPNADGLSAPFRADITYSAQENNDSATSQYAAVAGRLLNTQTIWGQPFDGSSPVKGSLKDVTDLTASGVISGSRLVSTVAQGTAPLTVGSTTMVAGLNSQYLGGYTAGGLFASFSSASGNEPNTSISIGGTSKSSKINADKLDGFDASYFASLAALQEAENTLSEGISSVSGRVSSIEDWFLSPELDELTVRTLNAINEINGNAKTATTLKNTRTIWGQNFNGSANVTGALSSVTNLNQLIYLSDGKVGIGKSSPAYTLDITGSVHATLNLSLGGSISMIGGRSIDFNSEGAPSQLYFSTSLNQTIFESPLPFHFECGVISDSYITAGASMSSSDRSMKANIVDFHNTMEILSAIKPREWDWNETSVIKGHCSGFIAQEIEAVMPYAVGKENNGKLALNYSTFHALEVSALQIHENRIRALEKENALLKNTIESLKKALAIK